MRVAALYDIHANLPALEAVIKEIRKADVDLIVVGGDVLPGPLPRESVTLLESLEIPTAFISGNGERGVLSSLSGGDAGGFPESFRDAMVWNGRQLSDEQRQSVGSWPLTRRMRIVGLGEVLFCHATPRSDTEVFTRLTPEADLRPVFSALTNVSVVICGHTHMPFDRRVGEVRVVNAGSVGAPFGSTTSSWLMLGPGVQFRQTTYDLDAAAELVRRSGYPLAEDFAAQNILSAPSEERMLEMFAGSSRRL